MNKNHYQSILIALSKFSPLFAKSILDRAIQKINKTPQSVTAIELLELLKTEINPKLSRGLNTTNALTQTGTGYIITDGKNEIVYKNSFIEKHFTPDFAWLHEKGFCFKIQELYELESRELSYNQHLYDITAIPLFNEKRKITGTVSIIKDITLRYRLEDEIILQSKLLKSEMEIRQKVEEELKEQQAQNLQSSKMASLGEMASGIAHEINNPLTIVLGGVGILKELLKAPQENQERIEQSISRITNGVSRVKNIVVAMRNLSHSQTKVEFAYQSLEKLISEVSFLCSEKFKNNNINFQVDYLSDNPNAFFNYIEFGQILINCLNNSYDAVSVLDEKWIRIEVHAEGKNQRVSIIDSGKGIPREVQAKLFQPFFTTKPVGLGVGLGMSISHQIMNRHNGLIKIDNSCPNTKIDLLLPMNA